VQEEQMQDPDTVPRDQVLIRSVQEADLDALVAIDAAASGRRYMNSISRG